MNRGIRVLQTLALPLGYVAIWESGAKDLAPDILCGAGDGARTRYLHLGKVALYQMSYARMYAAALRTLVPPVGIEPTTRGFSVRCSTN